MSTQRLSSVPGTFLTMAAISDHPTAILPCLPALRPRPRRLLPYTIAASVAPRRTVPVTLRDCRNRDPLARSFHGFQSAISLRMEHKEQALFASDRDSPNSVAKQSSSGDSSSSNGPPALAILARVLVFLFVTGWGANSLQWLRSQLPFHPPTLR